MYAVILGNIFVLLACLECTLSKVLYWVIVNYSSNLPSLFFNSPCMVSGFAKSHKCNITTCIVVNLSPLAAYL